MMQLEEDSVIIVLYEVGHSKLLNDSRPTLDFGHIDGCELSGRCKSLDKFHFISNFFYLEYFCKTTDILTPPPTAP